MNENKNMEQVQEGMLLEDVVQTSPIKEKLAKLIDVKSIVTLAVVAGFVAGFGCGTIEPKDYFTAVLMVLSFYFGTQSVKSTGTKS